MKKFNFKNFFARISENKFTIIICVLFSTVLWISTIMFNSNSYSVIKINDVPIVSNLSNTQAEQLGLSVVNFTPKTISVYVKGPRHKIAFVKKDDIVISPKNYSNIIASGSYNLELTAALKKPQQDISIESMSTKNVVFVVDVLQTKLVNLVADEMNIKVEEGYIKDETVCQPSSLFVSGPKQSIEKLDLIKLFVKGGPYNLNSSKTFDAIPHFIATDGGEMDGSLFKYNSDVKFKVIVPVYKVKKLPLKVLYKNAPECLNLDLLKPKIEPSFVEAGGAQELIKNTNEINLGYVNLKELSEEKTDFSFNLNLPSGLKNLNQISSATVSFNRDNLDSKLFNIKGVELINIPEDFSISINSKIIKDVKIVGLKGYLKNVNFTDLTATIDCSNVDVKKGMQNVPVNIGVIKKDGVWPVGEYRCSITVKKK